MSTFGGAIQSGAWLPMITSHPAKALALDAQIGQLSTQFKADITVLSHLDSDPSVNLLKAHLPDVQMVWLGGRLLYGDRAFVETARPGECELFLIQGSEKRICVKDQISTAPKHNQTLD